MSSAPCQILRWESSLAHLPTLYKLKTWQFFLFVVSSPESAGYHETPQQSQHLSMVSGAPEGGKNLALHLDVTARLRKQKVKNSICIGLTLTSCFEAELTDDSWRMLLPV